MCCYQIIVIMVIITQYRWGKNKVGTISLFFILNNHRKKETNYVISELIIRERLLPRRVKSHIAA